MDIVVLEERRIISTKEARAFLGIDQEPKVEHVFTSPTEVHLHLTFPKGLSKDQVERLRDAFLEKHDR